MARAICRRCSARWDGWRAHRSPRCSRSSSSASRWRCRRACALLVDNLRAATGDLSNAVDFTVHFKLGTPHRARAADRERARASGAGVESVTVTTADAGARGVQAGLGLRRCADGARRQSAAASPRRCGPTQNASGPAEIESLRRYFAAFPEVEIVQLDLDWVRRLHSLLDVLQAGRCGWSMAVLGLGVLAVIGNTIRLEIQHRRAEIEVTKLVGGSNAFVRRPFLYTGFFYGLGGALLAALIIVGGHRLPGPGGAETCRPSTAAASSWRAWEPRVWAILVGVGAVLGWLGAFISTGRHLRRIEPRA